MAVKTLFLALLFAAASCQKTENHSSRHNQEVRLNLRTEPPSLDPRKPNDTTSCSVLKMCYDGLMRIDEQGNPAFAIAEQVSISEDKKTYTFTLRKCVWSDGHPVTAQDFEYSWKCILDPQFPSEFSNELYVLRGAQSAKEGAIPISNIGVKALSDRVLQVDLEYPVPYFLDALTTHSFLPTPSHVAQKDPNWAKDEGPAYVCNGPFILKKWKHQNLLLLEKNPLYWDVDAVRLSQLSLYIINDENTELSMFENQELDWAGSPLSSLPLDALASLAHHADFHLHSIAGTYYYVFNTQSSPFHNVKIRKAFSLAIQRQEIVDNVLQGNQIPALSLTPPSLLGDLYAPQFQEDRKEAQRLFDEALQELGTDRKNLPPIIISYNTASAHHKIAQAIKEQWEQAFDIEVTLQNKEWKVFLDEIATHQFQIARLGGVANIKDPISFLDIFQHNESRLNHSLWSHPEFTQLLEQSQMISNPELRLQILAQAEEILMEAMPIAPIYFYTGSYLKAKNLKNVQVSDLSEIDFKYAYWEEPK